MSDIALHIAREDDTTSVSNTFIDYYMKDASGEYLKIYLYLLRCIGDKACDFSISKAADCLEHTQKDVSRALLYWERKGLLRLEYSLDGELAGICLVEPLRPVADDTLVRNVSVDRHIAASAPSTLAKSPDHSYSLDEQQLLARDPDVEEILFCTERYIGHPLSPGEINRVLYWYDGMHFSADLIEYLVEYCVELGHKNINYMNKVAFSWDEEGITTVEQAKDNTLSHHKLGSAICKAFGITGRTLTSVERQYLDRWNVVWGLDISIIEEACKRTILKTGRPSFQYANSILENWHKASVKTLDDIKVIDAEHSRTAKTSAINANNVRSQKQGDRFHNFNGHNYDFDSLENRLLNQQ